MKGTFTMIMEYRCEEFYIRAVGQIGQVMIIGNEVQKIV